MDIIGTIREKMVNNSVADRVFDAADRIFIDNPALNRVLDAANSMVDGSVADRFSDAVDDAVDRTVYEVSDRMYNIRDGMSGLIDEAIHGRRPPASAGISRHEKVPEIFEKGQEVSTYIHTGSDTPYQCFSNTAGYVVIYEPNEEVQKKSRILFFGKKPSHKFMGTLWMEDDSRGARYEGKWVFDHAIGRLGKSNAVLEEELSDLIEELEVRFDVDIDVRI